MLFWILLSPISVLKCSQWQWVIYTFCTENYRKVAWLLIKCSEEIFNYRWICISHVNTKILGWFCFSISQSFCDNWVYKVIVNKYHLIIMSEDAAISLLKRAVDLDQKKRWTESLLCYKEGLHILMEVIKGHYKLIISNIYNSKWIE